MRALTEEIRVRLAAELDNLPVPARRDIDTAVAEYHLLLRAVGIRDDHLVPPAGIGSLVRRLVATGLLVVVLAPLALMGLAVNLVPALLVAVAGAVVATPVSKGTNRVLAGVIAFPLAWGLLAVNDVGSGSLLVFVSAPMFGFLAVWLLEQVVRCYRTWQAVTSNVTRRRQVRDLREYRTEVLHRISTARTSGSS